MRTMKTWSGVICIVAVLAIVLTPVRAARMSGGGPPDQPPNCDERHPENCGGPIGLGLPGGLSVPCVYADAPGLDDPDVENEIWINCTTDSVEALGYETPIGLMGVNPLPHFDVQNVGGSELAGLCLRDQNAVWQSWTVTVLQENLVGKIAVFAETPTDGSVEITVNGVRVGVRTNLAGGDAEELNELLLDELVANNIDAERVGKYIVIHGFLIVSLTPLQTLGLHITDPALISSTLALEPDDLPLGSTYCD